MPINDGEDRSRHISTRTEPLQETDDSVLSYFREMDMLIDRVQTELDQIKARLDRAATMLGFRKPKPPSDE